jgi:hypothetical protein
MKKLAWFLGIVALALIVGGVGFFIRDWLGKPEDTYKQWVCPENLSQALLMAQSLSSEEFKELAEQCNNLISAPPIGETSGLNEEDVATQVAATVVAMAVQETPAEETAVVGMATPTPLGPTPTDWPSIFMKEDEIVAIPAGYTMPGDISICLTAEGECYETYTDEDPLTSNVWTCDEPCFASYDFGNGWAEHVSDPQVFVDAQLSDGCGNGCREVGNYHWPKDASVIGAPTVVSEVQPVEPTQIVEATPEPVTITEFTGEWFLPSWVEYASQEVFTVAQLEVTSEGVQKWMEPQNLPLVPPDALNYQAPPDDCVARDRAEDSCTTRRLQPISYSDVPIESEELLRMTGDAISICWSDNDELLVKRPDGDEKHDLWLVLNMSSEEIFVDINAPYGSDRSWYNSLDGWIPSLLDELMRQAIQDFNLQYRDEDDFAATPVPNCESPEGCSYSNIRVVVIFDDEVLAFTGKWFEKYEPHWEAFPPTEQSQ